MLRAVRAMGRLAHAVVHALAGLFTIVVVFPRLSVDARWLRVQAWATRMLNIMGITLRVEGTPPVQGPVLLVANHISWLDILVMHAARHCRFVAKSDIARWPLIGRLASGAGTLYIERTSRRDALRVVHRMAEGLREGDIVAVFPEGTTSDGTDVLPFHANLIQSALSVHAPAQPVALKFVDAATGAQSFAPSYINDDTLVGSLWRTLTAPRIVAVVRFGDLQQAAGRDRRAWANDLHRAVRQLLDGQPARG
ncbi:MAG: 1-acyl-sn-glycerol-3-phosphate acyltransferase [Burkholderiaceae bacterium]|nr:1-acyl-sn-glycerol-3-phosphate acyltransferase [Burkholderiaceae bacterium]